MEARKTGTTGAPRLWHAGEGMTPELRARQLGLEASWRLHAAVLQTAWAEARKPDESPVRQAARAWLTGGGPRAAIPLAVACAWTGLDPDVVMAQARLRWGTGEQEQAA